MSQKTKGLLSVMIPVIAWGISFVSTEFLLGYLGAMTIAAVRFVISTAILYAVMRATKTPLKIDKRDHFLFVIAGGVGIAVYFFFENTGIKYISASPSALIIAAIPMFTLIFEAIIYKRVVKWVDALAILASIVGVLLIVDLKWREFFKIEESIGYLMMMGAVISWVIYSMASKIQLSDHCVLSIFIQLAIFIIGGAI